MVRDATLIKVFKEESVFTVPFHSEQLTHIAESAGVARLKPDSKNLETIDSNFPAQNRDEPL